MREVEFYPSDEKKEKKIKEQYVYKGNKHVQTITFDNSL